MSWGYWALFVVLTISVYSSVVFHIFDSTKYFSFFYIAKDANDYYRITERCVLFPLFFRKIEYSFREERVGSNKNTSFITNIETAVNVLNRLKKERGNTWFSRYLEVRKELQDLHMAKLEAIKQEQLKKLEELYGR